MHEPSAHWTLLIPLVGPLQAWSLSGGPHRARTGDLFPTLSGVVGLLACALGRDRQADNNDLAALRLHVRIDQAGTLLRDFHSAMNFTRANGASGEGSLITGRDYLENAAFLACLEGPRELFETLAAALQHPTFVPYLGRRSCLPSLPLWHPDALSPARPEDVLAQTPDLTGVGGEKDVFLDRPGPLLRRDVPGPGRQFTERSIQYLRLAVQA